MANVTQENIGVQHEKITVKVTKEDYMPSVDKALKNYSKNASIPGFRKGMVPVGVVRKMYGQSVFADEVMNTAGRALEEHLISNKAEIFARPLPFDQNNQYQFDINNPIDYSFEFEIGTRPDFKLNLLDGKEVVPYYKVMVSHDMLEEEIERLQYKAGEMKPAELISSENNAIGVTFEEVDAQDQIIEGGIKKENSFLLKYFVPSLQSQLMDKKEGDFVVFDLKNTFEEKLLPAILRDLSLDPHDESSKEKRLRMTITKIEYIEPAPLTKETFEKIYQGRDIETEEAFREALTEEIQRYWDQQAKNRLHNELFEKLVHETDINIPHNFLKRWMSVGGETYRSPEEVEKEYGAFEHQMRWQLISDKIVEENNLQVEQEELDQAARMQIISYFGNQINFSGQDMDWMDSLVEKQLADKKFRDELTNRIITDKLFWVIEQKVKLEEKNISFEEFAKLPSSHHHHH